MPSMSGVMEEKLFLQNLPSALVGELLRSVLVHSSTETTAISNHSRQQERCNIAEKAGKPLIRVLDMCASPGGKTTHLAQIVGKRGEVSSIEFAKRNDNNNNGCPNNNYYYFCYYFLVLLVLSCSFTFFNRYWYYLHWDCRLHHDIIICHCY